VLVTEGGKRRRRRRAILFISPDPRAEARPRLATTAASSRLVRSSRTPQLMSNPTPPGRRRETDANGGSVGGLGFAGNGGRGVRGPRADGGGGVGGSPTTPRTRHRGNFRARYLPTVLNQRKNVTVVTIGMAGSIETEPMMRKYTSFRQRINWVIMTVQLTQLQNVC